mgnify:FL=1
MLTPDQLEALPRRFVQLWQQVEDDILQDIARRIKTLDELDPLTPTAIWQAWRLAETRAVRSSAVATLAKYTGKSRAEIKRLLETAGVQTLAADDAVYAAAGLDPPPVNQSAALLNLLNAGYRQTCGTWQNLTATTANTVTGAFEDRLSLAWGLVSTGAMDYNTAIRRAVGDLADTMPYITYPSGHTDTLEVAARRAVLTGVNQTCAKLQLERMEEMGCEFVEVTAHEGARPTHAVWQGRVYHRGGAVVQDGERYEDFETATGYGTGPGLCGWNCRHNFYPFYPGISVHNYTDERLAELDVRNIPYGGGLYTKYEITQMQRALERKVRRYKRRYLAETAAGVDASQSAAKLKIARQQLSAFLAETGERLDGARAEVPGFGRREARLADADQKRYTNPAASGILDPSNRIGVNPDVNYICDLNPEIYKAAVPTITTEHVIITDKQLEHIRERHPDISATVMEQLTEIIHAPDYIIETDMPYTANILKHLEINGKGYQLVLRIRTDSDPEEFQNSVITFMSVNEKRYRQYLRNRKILYSRE